MLSNDPPAFSTLHIGRPPDASSIFSSRSSSPAAALRDLPSNSRQLPPARRTPPTVYNLTHLLEEASAVRRQREDNDFLSGPNLASPNYNDLHRNALFEHPLDFGLGSFNPHYDQISHEPLEININSTVHRVATPRMSNEAYWHTIHLNARLGEDVAYTEFLNAEWPLPPYDTVASEPLNEPPSSPSPLSRFDAGTNLTDLQPPPTLARWPHVCGQCFEDHAPNGHIVYQSEHQWFVHAWTEHTNQAEWTPRYCFWPGCINGVLYQTSKKCLDHIASVHDKKVHCTYQGCEFEAGNGEGKAFGTQSDLTRHEQMIHDDPIFCELPYCTHKRVRLNRTDHRKKHTAKYHGPFCCSVSKCLRGRIGVIDYGFETQALLDKHMQEGKHRAIDN